MSPSHFRLWRIQREGWFCLEIPSATTSPVEFERTAYCRIGSATPRLSDYPDRQKTLWNKLQPYLWESGTAAQFLTDDDVLARIDYASYFALMDQPLMANPQAILERLNQDRIITPDVGGRWNITNLGAILFANRLDEFVNGELMKNSSLRARLGIDTRNAAQVSQVIRRARDRQLIKVADPERPQSGYVPFWA